MQQHIKLHFYCILLFCYCLPTYGVAQTLDHVLGEILVQLKHEDELKPFLISLHRQEIASADIHLIKKLQAPSPIYLIHFDQNVLNEFHFLARVQGNSFVETAQFNHLIESRTTTPNDPFFNLQWYYSNDGSFGGLVDADLDIDLAWDVTTGGVSAAGDTIVICVVDEGFDLGHEDFENNLWRNYEEIPNNGIDDDGNNYIDDYQGWNVNSADDNIVTDLAGLNHGMPVTGIIGAKGNNGMGISGVNWNTKLMIVVRGNTEAEIIESYTYPFLQRKLYNQTAGLEGSFVVAVNSSWGLNFGQANEAPLWCAFYDSLGTQGIVCPAATINADQNIDVVGDLPTTCPSDYLISMTSIDNSNTKVTNAGYGAEHIDIAAYGEKIATTAPNNGYSFFNGTSLTSPQVSGAVALMYAACPSLAALAKSNPPEAASQVRNIILDAAQPNPSLVGITAYAAQLNINKCFEELLTNCDFSGCYGPYSIELPEVLENQATINWIADTTNNFINLRYRIKGNPNWISINFLSAPYQLTGLNACTDYEFQLKPVCDNFLGNFTSSIEFKTDGCCVAPDHLTAESSPDASLITWNPVAAANSYTFDYRLAGTMGWTSLPSATNEFILNNLASCTDYEFRVLTNCNTGVDSEYSPTQFFSTKDCGLCLDLPYCEASGPAFSSNTWISRFKLGDTEKISSNENGGYSDFTDSSTDLIRGYFEFVEMETDYEFFEINSIFKIWIDFNQNGAFEDDISELVFDPVAKSTSKIGFFTIPPTAKLGSTRMRIAARDESYSPCGVLGFAGEVEDYCVNIIESSDCLKPGNIQSFVEEDKTTVTWLSGASTQTITVSIRLSGTTTWEDIGSPTTDTIVLNDLQACSDYDIQVRADCDDGMSALSNILQFSTKGCGSCLDIDYCLPSAGQAAFEWIESFSLHTLTNNSGPDMGYVFCDVFTTTLQLGASYPISLTPGFANGAFEEYFTVWIDYDQNGVFNDSTELVYDPGIASTTTVSGNINIPLGALEGSTRMRVVMKYQNAPESACEGDFSGEIEDYCINISSDPDYACAHPSFVNYFEIDNVTLLFEWSEMPEAIVYQFRYRELDANQPWITLTTESQNIPVTDLMPCVTYEYQIRVVCGEGLSAYSESLLFTPFCITASTEQVLGNSNIQVFPNPFFDRIQLLFSKPEKSQIELYDLSGKKLLQIEKPASSQIDLVLPQDLASGIYLLEVTSTTQHQVLRLVKYQN